MLNEYKNISNKVANFSNELFNIILDDNDGQPYNKSLINGSIFIENKIEINKNNVSSWPFNYIDRLSLTYVIYITDTLQQYNQIMEMVGAEVNSESDYEAKRIKIVSGLINDYAASDFLPTIFHEVNHLFEYDNGRQKRVDLYDKVLNLMSQQNQDAKFVGNAIYFSFQHEIDAFVHQFYGFLVQEEPDHLSFEELLQYSPYQSAKNAFDNVVNRINNKEIIKYINYLGYSKNNYIKRLKFGLKKLFAKIKNAYLRYRYETAKMTEGNAHRLLNNEKNRIFESKKYKTEIKWEIESIYNFRA